MFLMCFLLLYNLFVQFFLDAFLSCSEFVRSMSALLTPQQPRGEWVLSWPGQVVIAGCQVFWTTEVSEALEQGDLANRLYPQLQTQV